MAAAAPARELVAERGVLAGAFIRPTRPGATDGREPPAGHVGSDGHLADGRRLVLVGGVGGWVGGWVVMGGCARSLRPWLAVVLLAGRPTHDAIAHIQHTGQARARARAMSPPSTSQLPSQPSQPSQAAPRRAARPRASHLFFIYLFENNPQKTLSNSRAEKPSPSDADNIYFFSVFPRRARARAHGERFADGA